MKRNIIKNRFLSTFLIIQSFLILSTSCNSILHSNIRSDKYQNKQDNRYYKLTNNIKNKPLNVLGTLAFITAAISEVSNITGANGSFIKKYPKRGDSIIGLSAAIASDSTIWSCGKNLTGNIGFFTKHTKNLNFEFERTISSMNEATAIYQLSYDKVGICGIEIDDNGFNDIRILSASSPNYLTQNFVANFGGDYDDYPVFIREIILNNIVVGGYSKSFGSGMEDIISFSVSDEGEYLWGKAYGNSQSNIISSGHCKINVDYNDDEYICKGNILYAGYTGNSKKNGLVIEINPKVSGNLVDSYTISASEDIELTAVKPSLDGGTIHAGKIAGLYNSNNLLLAKTNSANTLLWATEVTIFTDSKAGTLEAYDVVENPNDNTIAVTGQYINYFSNQDPLGDAFIAIFEQDGEFVNLFTPEGKSKEIGRKIFVTSENKIVVVGETSSFGDNKGLLLTRVSAKGKSKCTKRRDAADKDILSSLTINPISLTTTNISNTSYSLISNSLVDVDKKQKSKNCKKDNCCPDSKFYKHWYTWVIFGGILIVGILLIITIICLCRGKS